MRKFFVLLFITSSAIAQNRYELNSGWLCSPIANVQADGETISSRSFSTKNWLPATVPGTVLTTLLNNKKVPDPFYGLNNEKIPDIYTTGRDHYTYWFVKDFNEKPGSEQVWLQLRGVNYSCDVFLNGHKLNETRHHGMFLRQSYNISGLLKSNNRLAIIVYPVDPVGNPNGGQGGDGTIARNVSHQYVAGWDWIQPIRDRNTGIWDKVSIERTGVVNISNPHIVTKVPNERTAQLYVTAELENCSDKTTEGALQYEIDGQISLQAVSLEPRKTTTVSFPVQQIKDPQLWWPAGYGEQHLYPVRFRFLTNDKNVSDSETVMTGIREIQTNWNSSTRSMEVAVNGKKLFIKGGNWIISDAMLRFSDQRYDAEVRYHRDMNLNLLRVWGGALIERPEFYQACDKYGLLVMQDFWMSGDCNGRWIDPMKKEDQWTRRKYPDDHHLFLQSAIDQVKLVRNHPSLAIWCGGNEITPPEDILNALKDSILPAIDGTRWFVDYSNSDSMSYNFIGGNGDGPYGIQDIRTFWDHRTWPFNSEVGSVGVGDYVSLQRFIPKENLNPPAKTVDPVWEYHKYIGYQQYVEQYGKVKDAEDFTKKAQLVNYNQYRALAEGFSAHTWEWYTGFIIWKTQNPWTALRGQMYDYYLDPNAGLFGLRSGSEPVHAMCHPADKMIYIVNNTPKSQRDLMLVVRAYDMSGKDSLLTQVFTYMEPSSVKKILPVKETLDNLGKEKGVFLSLQLVDANRKVVSDNFYWWPGANNAYNGLESLRKASVTVKANQLTNQKIAVTLSNPAGNTVAFFTRISLINAKTKERILPAFYSDNYVSVLPGTEKTITIEHTSTEAFTPVITVEGWNVDAKSSKVN